MPFWKTMMASTLKQRTAATTKTPLICCSTAAVIIAIILSISFDYPFLQDNQGNKSHLPLWKTADRIGTFNKRFAHRFIKSRRINSSTLRKEQLPFIYSAIVTETSISSIYFVKYCNRGRSITVRFTVLYQLVNFIRATTWKQNSLNFIQ